LEKCATFARLRQHHITTSQHSATTRMTETQTDLGEQRKHGV
jgi:hypothetical protein